MIQKNIKVNALLNTIKTIFSIIFPLVTFPYVSRVLMPENIGKVNFGLSFVSYFSLIASLGINTYAIRECSAKRHDVQELSKTASVIFSINGCTTLAAYGLLLLVLFCVPSLRPYRVLILCQSMTILCTTLGCEWLNTAMEDFGYITIRTIGFQILAMILMFAFVKTPQDYLIYALILVLSSSGAQLVNVFYRRKYCTVRLLYDPEWKKHIKPITLLFAMILAQTIFNSSDITMLGFMKGDFEVGLYSSAVKMSSLVSQVVSSMAWVIMPRMSILFRENDYEKINVTLRKVLCFLVTLGFPCAVGCICLSREILCIIAGEAYTEASVALSLLMVCLMFGLVGGSFLGNMVLLPSQREGVYMKICCVATAVNLILNFFMIPVWGANAAAFTTALCSFLIFAMLLATKDKRIVIQRLGSVFAPPVVGCIVVAGICCLVKTIWEGVAAVTVVSIALSVIAYLVIQLIMKNEILWELLSGLYGKLWGEKA